MGDFTLLAACWQVAGLAFRNAKHHGSQSFNDKMTDYIRLYLHIFALNFGLEHCDQTCLFLVGHPVLFLVLQLFEAGEGVSKPIHSNLVKKNYQIWSH